MHLTPHEPVRGHFFSLQTWLATQIRLWHSKTVSKATAPLYLALLFITLNLGLLLFSDSSSLYLINDSLARLAVFCLPLSATLIFFILAANKGLPRPLRLSLLIASGVLVILFSLQFSFLTATLRAFFRLPPGIVSAALMAATIPIIISIFITIFSKENGSGYSTHPKKEAVLFATLFSLAVFALTGISLVKADRLASQFTATAAFYFPPHLPLYFPSGMIQTSPPKMTAASNTTARQVTITYGPLPGKRYPSEKFPGTLIINEYPASPTNTAPPTDQPTEVVTIPAAKDQKGFLATTPNATPTRYSLTFVTPDNIAITLSSLRLKKDVLLQIARSIN